MATEGEVQGQCPDRVGSEDLDQLKCQPCLEGGNLHEAVGMCVDCQDYLCSQCFKFHTLPKPSRDHQLLDKQRMLQCQIRISPKDICTEKCAEHEYKVIEYYCKTHSLLGCTVCITLNHATCKSVQYIPHAANNLTNNEEYRQVENQLNSALATFEKVAENVQKNVEELGITCNDALEKIGDYRKKVDKAFDKLEANLVEQAKTMKSNEIKELAAISDKYQTAHTELQATLANIEKLQKSKQYCSLYTEMMRTKEKLNSFDAQIKEAEVDKSYREYQIKFSPNQGTFDSLKNSDTFGMLSVTGTSAKVNRRKDTIVSAKHSHDILVKAETDAVTCCIMGLAMLHDGRLVLADRSRNSKIKTVNVQSGQILTELKLSSPPWDIAVINNNKVAVTLPDAKRVAIVTVGDKNLSIDRTLTMSGTCCGIDYRNDKLAVSFIDPQQVQVLNLQGTVLHTISADKQGKALFSHSQYLTFGQDDKTLYVSSYKGNNVICVNLDGTLVATYRDSNLQSPMKPVIDNHGNVYVCSSATNQVHKFSKDCKKIQVLMTRANGLSLPCSICLSVEEDMLYVGISDNDNVIVYKTERRTQ